MIYKSIFSIGYFVLPSLQHWKKKCFILISKKNYWIGIKKKKQKKFKKLIFNLYILYIILYWNIHNIYIYIYYNVLKYTQYVYYNQFL